MKVYNYRKANSKKIWVWSHSSPNNVKKLKQSECANIDTFVGDFVYIFAENCSIGIRKKNYSNNTPPPREVANRDNVRADKFPMNTNNDVILIQISIGKDGNKEDPKDNVTVEDDDASLHGES